MNYITLMIDKSAFQGLSPREAKWLFHHFRVNLPPIFFAEILADLTKRKPTTGSGEGDVSALAKKIGSHSVHVNASAQDLMSHELRGHQYPLDGRIVDERSEILTNDRGELGIVIDSVPTQEMIKRWVAVDFTENERDFARLWRQGISSIKLEEQFRLMKSARRKQINSAKDVIEFVNGILRGRDFEMLKNLYALIDAPEIVRDAAIDAWRRRGKPHIADFAPYSYFTLRIELYFLVGLTHGVVTTRDSNRIDIEYVKYLPFTQTFCSADNLQITAVENFLLPHNSFINGTELKNGMREIADHWDSVAEEVRAQGTATFADFPPTNLNNSVTQIYDRYIPDWREGANLPRPPITPEHSAKIMAELKPMMDAIEARRKKP